MAEVPCTERMGEKRHTTRVEALWLTSSFPKHARDDPADSICAQTFPLRTVTFPPRFLGPLAFLMYA